MTRDFIIQRYASGTWDNIRGKRPFIVTGPNFKQWVVPGSLSRIGMWLLRPDLLRAVGTVFPVGRVHREDRLVLAEILLVDGLVQALWCTGRPDSLPPERRWEIAVREVAAETVGGFRGELSATFDMARELAWGLATLPGPEIPRAHVAEDGLVLEEMAIVSHEKKVQQLQANDL